MHRAVEIVAVMLLPTLIGCAVLVAVRLGRWVAHRLRAGGEPRATAQPIERIAADARRLRRELIRLESGAPGPGRGVRVRALRAAYAEALDAACRALEVAPPPAAGGTVRAADLYRVEADLLLRGLDVRSGAVN